MSPATTTARLLRLLSLLQTRREWPGPELADRLDVTARTVRRDVDRLRAMGYAVGTTRGSAGGYRLEPGAELPPLLLDEEQVTAIAVALQAVPLLGAGVEDAAERADRTLRRVMPPRLRRRADALRYTALPPATALAAAPATEALLALSAAVRAREVVRFDYGDPGPGPDGTAPLPPRRAEPHHLVAARGRWYLVAWDLDRGDWRLFRADRMALRPHTGARFPARDVPGGDVARFVAARFRGAASTDDWPCRGTVVLDLPAREVAPFAGDGVVEPVDAGRCRLTTGSWSWPALAASLLRFDARVEVTGPPELAAAFATLAERCREAGSPRATDRRPEPARDGPHPH
ncbi:WYL domain-containing protein [Cellulomonas hominis]|jgi:predicted DNA-binding transcriptional regulator YafY|uniref:helix-turn-helix transcriptional regulator n=1 Tax=Cellulomonas hominis TaxID=156981 RepID=UPI001C10DBC8|nr:WYL domain-containing protein [Cellulomonas hominis]MBU5423028.1 WYL domain-containing protein [Cellulomonas hominis]